MVLRSRDWLVDYRIYLAAACFVLAASCGPRGGVNQNAEQDEIVDAPSTDPDRRAAQWVLGTDGQVAVVVNEQERWLTASERLPDEPFQVTQIKWEVVEWDRGRWPI